MEALRYQRSVIKTGWYEGHADGRAEGLAEGRAEGLAEGRAEGHAEGRAEGLAEGEVKKAKEIAKNMKSMGVPIDTIMQCTQLSAEEIEKL